MSDFFLIFAEVKLFVKLKNVIMKKLFISITVQDGENSHTHKQVIQTNATNIEFVAQRHVSSYYDSFCYRDGNVWYFYSGTIAAKLEKVEVLSDEEFEVLKKFI